MPRVVFPSSCRSGPSKCQGWWRTKTEGWRSERPDPGVGVLGNMEKGQHSDVISDAQTMPYANSSIHPNHIHLNLKTTLGGRQMWKLRQRMVKVLCPYGHSPTSKCGLGMKEVKKSGWVEGGQRKLRVGRNCQGGCLGICGPVTLPCGLAWSQG